MIAVVSAEIERQASALITLYQRRKLLIVTAESCTGGLVAGTLTAIAGSSRVVERGFVTYSNEAKTEVLGVPAELIERIGAVSADVALQMADGALAHSRGDVAVSVTGIAGPSGGSEQKPVGLVYFACARRGYPPKIVEKRFGDIGRTEVRLKSVKVALDLLREAGNHHPGP
ncbi:MAG: CinA family protein [Beijerinckiaceae bacterium]